MYIPEADSPTRYDESLAFTEREHVLAWLVSMHKGAQSVQALRSDHKMTCALLMIIFCGACYPVETEVNSVPRASALKYFYGLNQQYSDPDVAFYLMLLLLQRSVSRYLMLNAWSRPVNAYYLS
jgi:hypothetical protein